MPNIPSGFQTITPYFFCDQPRELGDFLIAAFGGEEILCSLGPNGSIVNLQIKVGTVTVMISQSVEAYPAMPMALYIYVDDADHSMELAQQAGATLEMPVMDMSYGDRQGGVRDAFGNIWWISQRLSDQPYSI
ncbi:MAG: VOC family protein [Gammaproteobacteria bacterium]|nr:VOC family protein [Gammaproteobacteria bacterium]